MSGKKKVLHKWKLASLFIITVLFVSIVFLTITIPKKYETYQYEYINNIKAEISESLNTENVAENMVELRNKYNFDIIVIANDTLLYTSNGLYDFESSSEIVNTGYIYQEVYNTNEYSIWLTVYNINIQEFIYTTLIQIAVLVILELICMITTMLILLKRAINPLNKLSEIILMLKNDKKVLEIDSKIDEIGMELIKVSSDLRLKLYSYEEEKIEYHRRYNVQNNLLYEQKKYLASVVHDVKSTFLAIKFSSEYLSENIKLEENKDELQALKSIEVSSSKALESITESIDNVVNDSYNIYIDKTDIKVKQAISKYFEYNKMLLFEKNLKVEITGEEQVIFENLIKFNQTINNILSNMIKNASKNSTLEIKIKENECIFKNEVDSSNSKYSNSYGMQIINESLENTNYIYDFSIKKGIATGILQREIKDAE